MLLWCNYEDGRAHLLNAPIVSLLFFLTWTHHLFVQVYQVYQGFPSTHLSLPCVCGSVHWLNSSPLTSKRPNERCDMVAAAPPHGGRQASMVAAACVQRPWSKLSRTELLQGT